MPLALTDVSGVGPSTADILITNNIDTVEKLAGLDIKELTLVPGIGVVTGQNMLQAARNLLAANPAESGPASKEKSAGGKDKKKDKKKDGKNKKNKKGKKGKKGKKDKKDKKGKNKKGKKNNEK